jgi:hypothetical protein
MIPLADFTAEQIQGALSFFGSAGLAVLVAVFLTNRHDKREEKLVNGHTTVMDKNSASITKMADTIATKFDEQRKQELEWMKLMTQLIDRIGELERNGKV